MLGIGFIIAHFVAMQKPQQRKYHSSCNRSVHRGTAHGKQRVKVCKRKTPHLFLMRSFLPPCGDKLQFSNNIIDSKIMRLSSPCGDKLQFHTTVNSDNGTELSSPCGDKLQYATCGSTPRSPGYRPLAGISCNPLTSRRMSRSSTLSSPCGDKLQCMNDFHYTVLTPLSSPCGDKLQCRTFLTSSA